MHFSARLFLLMMIGAISMDAGQSGVLSTLNEYRGGLPPTRKILESVDGNYANALSELRVILGSQVHSAMWPGAIFALGVVGAYIGPMDEMAVVDELARFMDGKPFTETTASLSSDAVYFEEQARLTVPTAFAFFCALNAPASKGNEPPGRSAPRAVVSLDQLERILRQETSDRKWRSGKDADRNLDLRFRALRALVLTGREDANGRIQASYRDIKHPALKAEVGIELKRAKLELQKPPPLRTVRARR